MVCLFDTAMQTLAMSTSTLISSVLVCLVLTLTIAGSRMQASAVETAAAATGDMDRQQPSTVLLARLRTAVQRIKQLADEVDAVLGLVEADSEVDETSGRGSDMLQQLIRQDKRSKSIALKSGRRYDSYGVAGRFGRSVDKQLQQQ